MLDSAVLGNPIGNGAIAEGVFSSLFIVSHWRAEGIKG